MNTKKTIKIITTGALCSTAFLTTCNNKSLKNEQTVEKTTDSQKQPNILWIVADDLGTDLGCYGEKLVHTPNLDKLASEGVRYTNMYTVTAVSSPSRSALITGMYPTSIKCHQHRTRFKDSLPRNVKPVTHYFREAGYFCTNGDFRDSTKPGKQDYNFLADNIYDGTDWSQRKPGQPFFSQVQIFYPHRPFKRDPSHPVDEKMVKLPPYYPNHRIARQDWALYLEFIQLLDKEVGKVLQRLQNEGLADSTIVFFFGDQGRPHVRAKQFLYDSGINTPLIVRWKGVFDGGTVSNQLISNIDLAPAAMRMAGITPPEYIQGQSFWGQNTKPRNYIFAMRDRRDGTVDRIRAVRTKDFKYILNFYPERPYTQFNGYKKQAYPVLTLMQVLKKQNKLNDIQLLFMAENRPEEELYRLKNDPFEVQNIANDTACQEKLLELRQQLKKWLDEADKGKYPEAQKAIDFSQDLMRKRYAKRQQEKGLPPNPTDLEILKYWENYLTPTK